MIDDDLIWGNTLLSIVLEAIGGIDGNVTGITLHAEYGMFTTVTIRRPGLADEMRTLPHFGTEWLSPALAAPRGLQAITVDIAKEMFTIVNCRYVPIEASIDKLIAALKAVSAIGAEQAVDET